MTSIILRLPGGLNQISVVHGMKEKEKSLFLTLSHAACPLPMSRTSRAGLWGPKAAALPQPLLPLLALSLGSLWMVEQISAVPHKCALGLCSRCCLALAGRILVKSCIRGNLPWGYFFLLESIFTVLQNSESSSQCCRPADYCKLFLV